MVSSALFLSKSKSCLGSGSVSWFYFGFQYQTYISYIEDTYQILFGSANYIESYCVHSQTDRQTGRQTDRRNFFCLFCILRLTKHEHSSKGKNFFFTHAIKIFSFFYILRMWWESKKILFMHLLVLAIFWKYRIRHILCGHSKIVTIFQQY